MARGAHESNGGPYLATALMLTAAALFPVGLMVFNPTLMFERGWEQYVGTGIYLWAVLTLGKELIGLWRDERAFEDAPALLKSARSPRPAGVGAPGEGAGPSPRAAAGAATEAARILPRRAQQLAACTQEGRGTSVSQLMEVNREASGLDQEQAAGRFTLTRYILYLLPVIGFIGTVEGISRALMNISKVLPMVKDLDGFMSNLTGVTSALQIAFDSTLLALFLSAALMLVQTLVYRRSEELLARVDRWVVENLLPRLGADDATIDRLASAIGPRLDAMGERLAEVLGPPARALGAQAATLSESLKAPIAQFSAEIERLPAALQSFEQGARAISRVGVDLEAIGSAGEALRLGAASLNRIETALAELGRAGLQLDEIRRGIDRAGTGIDSLAGSWSAAYERSSRATQEQLARSLTSLKDALELLNVSMEQGNSLYRNIVRKLFDERADASPHRPDAVRVA